MKKILALLVMIIFCFGIQVQAIEADAKITVIGKRLPTKYGVRAATLPYRVYIGGSQELNSQSNVTVGDVLSRTTGVVQFNSNTSAVDQSLSMGGFSSIPIKDLNPFPKFLPAFCIFLPKSSKTGFLFCFLLFDIFHPTFITNIGFDYTRKRIKVKYIPVGDHFEIILIYQFLLL